MVRRGFDDVADAIVERVFAAFSGLSQSVFELGEELLDGVQVRAVRWQDDQPCTDAPDELSDVFGFVAAEVVHGHDVAVSQGW